MSGLAGRTILVTGASGGIGRATVERLASTGARVIGHCRSNPEGALEAIAAFPEGKATIVQADLADPQGASDLWQAALDWAGRIDVVVLNAAMMPKVELDDTDDAWNDTFEQALQVNTLSQLTLIRRSLAHFLTEGGGTIVGLSSWVTQRGAGNPNLVAYAASKAATAAALKTVARAYAADGVLTYLIAPGAVDTAMSASAGADRGGRDAVLQTLAMGEMVPPAEIAELIALLAGGRVRHLSGATLDVNGATYVR
ncbi:SDR family oxidoreductase [Microbacterium sp. ABRD28]|uniref:SDR family NAD(P)-dependent oxidoreductase n=1 Tax=Microbacterium sp. ABRD28 TaxID=2268461 RepID=UPI000F54E8DA|nr:SDR family oxidoreductase [Microbacterium sp. ABRD28]AZC14722.1 SDR family NAD(P)-dependent oxidoreductase [Microbacterium sp. ABRD28]